MKKLSLLFIALSLITAQTQCASTQALSYLKLASTAAWQGTKKSALWAAKNPKKTVSTVGLSILAWDADQKVQEHEKKVLKDIGPLIKELKNKEKEDKQGILYLCKEICKQQHGLDVTVIYKPGDYSIAIGKFGTDILVIIDPKIHTMLLTPLEYEALLCHEVAHILGQHIRWRNIALAHLFTISHYLKKVIGHDFDIKDKVSWFNNLCKYQEEQADANVVTVAFNEKRPELLDAFSNSLEIFNKHLINDTTLYPPVSKRIKKAQTAAAELRELIDAEKKGVFFLQSDGEMTPMQKTYCP